jgi:diketogulonate reductase-like aldo/keto reductase
MRSFVGAGLGLGIAVGLAAEQAGLGSAVPASAQTPERPAPQAADIITKTIPGTNERLPAIGLGTFMTFDLMPGEGREHLRAWKKEGRIRFVSATHHDPAYFGILADWVESGSVDFVQVHYSIATRQAEDRVLKAAADHGVGVFVNMPLEKARLHKVVAGRALPDFARELGIETWSQFFLKWVISHPAITCALQATSNPDHLAENVGALRGPLPDREMRARMVRHMEDIAGFDHLAQMPWYPEKRYAGLINRALGATRART